MGQHPSPWELCNGRVHAVLCVQQHHIKSQCCLQALKQSQPQVVLLLCFPAGDSWRQLGRISCHHNTPGTLQAHMRSVQIQPKCKSVWCGNGWQMRAGANHAALLSPDASCSGDSIHMDDRLHASMHTQTGSLQKACKQQEHLERAHTVTTYTKQATDLCEWYQRGWLSGLCGFINHHHVEVPAASTHATNCQSSSQPHPQAQLYSESKWVCCATMGHAVPQLHCK